MKTLFSIYCLLISIASYCQENGEHREYYNNGKLKSISHYKDGLRDGEWKTFYDDGNIEKIENYKNDEENGEWKEYFANGNLRRIMKCINGLPNGEEKGYYEGGELYYLGLHENGLCKWKEYYESGILKSEGQYLVRHFLDIVYTKNGEWKAYYENGNLKSIEQYKYDVQDGKQKYFSENGKLIGNGDFENGSGEWKAYYESGAIYETIAIKDGDQNGVWNVFSEDGKQMGSGLYSYLLYDGFFTETHFPQRAFENSVASAVYLDSLALRDFENNNFKIGKKIPIPKTFDFSSYNNHDFRTNTYLFIINELKKQTNNFNNIEFNKGYICESRYSFSEENWFSGLTGHDADTWEVRFIDNYKFKINYSYHMGKVGSGKSNFYFDLKTNKSSVTIISDECDATNIEKWHGIHCWRTTLKIKDNILISKKNSEYQ